MTDFMDKAQFLERVRRARAEWEAALDRLDEGEWLAPGFGGEWTAKDTVAHITWHEKEMLGLIAARALAGSDWWNLPLHERNALIYAENQDRPLQEVRREAADVYARLLEALDTLSEEDLNDPARFKDMPPDWKPWQLIADNTYDHYEDHTRAARSRPEKS